MGTRARVMFQISARTWLTFLEGALTSRRWEALVFRSRINEGEEKLCVSIFEEEIDFLKRYGFFAFS